MKNNNSETGDYYISEMPWLVIDRRRPGAGYRHLLDAGQIRTFLRLIPGWQQLEGHLNAIVLDGSQEETFGWHTAGVIGICAWPRDLWINISVKGYQNERPWLEMLEVPCVVDEPNDCVTCQFTEDTARAHQLLGTLLHEIGHHLDRITTRSKEKACRGEPFARDYSLKTAQEIFPRYLQEFFI